MIKSLEWLYELSCSLSSIGVDEEDILKEIKKYINNKSYIFLNNKLKEIVIDAETIVYFTSSHNRELYDEE